MLIVHLNVSKAPIVAGDQPKTFLHINTSSEILKLQYNIQCNISIRVEANHKGNVLHNF